MVSVTLPEMGESVTEGSIVEWRKRVGDFVTEGDPLVEVTTDKVDVEVPATASGMVTQIAAREGEKLQSGLRVAQQNLLASVVQGHWSRLLFGLCKDLIVQGPQHLADLLHQLGEQPGSFGHGGIVLGLVP